MENALLLVVFFVGTAFFILAVTVVAMLKSQQKKLGAERKEKRHLEFSKIIMGVMIAMWVCGGFVGFWVVVAKDFTYIEKIQTYVSYPLTAGIAFYSAKAGAENIKKLSNTEEIMEKEEYE